MHELHLRNHVITKETCGEAMLLDHGWQAHAYAEKVAHATSNLDEAIVTRRLDTHASSQHACELPDDSKAQIFFAKAIQLHLHRNKLS
jgi:hypothetical protein